MDGIMKILDSAGRTIGILEQQLAQATQRIKELEAQLAAKSKPEFPDELDEGRT